MKKGVLFGFLAVAGIGATAYLGTQHSDKDYYQARENEEATEKGIAGAMEWWRMVRANQNTGEVSLQDELSARKRLEQMTSLQKKSSATINWEDFGPDNFGGRTRGFLIDQQDPNVFYAASVSGGLFKSTDAGASWTEVTTLAQRNVAVACVAQASDGTIYFGTGEGMYGSYQGNGNTSSPNLIGGGIYKLSTDGSIELLSSTDPTAGNGDFINVGKIEVDPNNPQRIYAATNRGLRRSDDGGQSWTNPLLSLGVLQQAPDMTVSPTGAVWVKAGASVYSSPNGNDGSFTNVTSNSNLPSNNNRMRIAISPEDDNYVYISSIADNQSFEELLRTTDGGATWTSLVQGGPGTNPHANQGYWNNALTVDPNDKDRVILGGLDLYEWSASAGFNQLSLWFLEPGNPYYVHADNHNIVFHPTKANTFYVLNDGGVFRTNDNGQNFTMINKGYQTTQFYHITVGPGNRVAGGTQDNGTFLIDPSKFFSKNGVEIRGGDGGYAQMSRLQPGVTFAESQNGAIGRSTDYGESFDNFIDRARMDWQFTSNNPNASVIGTPAWSNWIMPYKLWEKYDDPNSTDSLSITAAPVVSNLGVGAGRKIFQGAFLRPYSYTYQTANGTKTDSAQYVVESLEITAGNLSLTYDSQSGLLVGDGQGSFDPATGSFTAEFNRAINSDQVIATIDVRYEAGTVIRLLSRNGDLPVFDTLSSPLEPGDRLVIQDPRQALMAIGLRTQVRSNDNNDGGIWVTREAVSRLEGVPEWHHVASLNNNEAPTSMDISGDGDMIFVGTNQGNVYRISNLSMARDSASADIDHRYDNQGNLVDSSSSIVETKLIFNSGGNRSVTGLSVHPFDSDKLVITMGNYGNNNYIYYSSNASAQNPAVVPADGNYPDFPAYCAIFNYNDPDGTEVLIGTEYGVFQTDDIEAGTSVQWTQQNNGMANVMVMSLVQDLTVRYDDPDKVFEGSIWAGTHGRGIFKTKYAIDYVGQEEYQEELTDKNVASLNIYPNPAEYSAKVELKLNNRADVKITVRNLSGQLVKSRSYNNVSADREYLEIELNGLATGTYLLTLEAEGKQQTGKLIKR